MTESANHEGSASDSRGTNGRNRKELVELVGPRPWMSLREAISLISFGKRYHGNVELNSPEDKIIRDAAAVLFLGVFDKYVLARGIRIGFSRSEAFGTLINYDSNKSRFKPEMLDTNSMNLEDFVFDYDKSGLISRESSGRWAVYCEIQIERRSFIAWAQAVEGPVPDRILGRRLALERPAEPTSTRRKTKVVQRHERIFAIFNQAKAEGVDIPIHRQRLADFVRHRLGGAKEAGLGIKTIAHLRDEWIRRQQDV